VFGALARGLPRKQSTHRGQRKGANLKQLDKQAKDGAAIVVGGVLRK